MAEDCDDEDLAIRMMCGDREALREVLRRYLLPVKDLLTEKYGTTVQEADIDEAMNLAMYKMFQTAGSYDKSKATLRAWFYTIAQSALIDIYRREKRHRRRFPLRDPEYDPAGDFDDPDPEEPVTKEEKQEIRQLNQVIENKLKGLQKAIILADLVAGGRADAAALAERFNTTKDSIYVSRHKAREKIRAEMPQFAQDQTKLRGAK